MKRPKLGFAVCLAVLLGLSAPAWAHDHWHHHHHWGVGVYLGPPVVWPVYPPPVYYTPPVIIREVPPVYIERGSTGYWYYCDNPSGYYPYVTECLGLWRAVPPVPNR